MRGRLTARPAPAFLSGKGPLESGPATPRHSARPCPGHAPEAFPLPQPPPALAAGEGQGRGWGWQPGCGWDAD
eukprot:15434570-Alexandrium_andersonii.AAC.1